MLFLLKWQFFLCCSFVHYLIYPTLNQGGANNSPFLWFYIIFLRAIPSWTDQKACVRQIQKSICRFESPIEFFLRLLQFWLAYPFKMYAVRICIICIRNYILCLCLTVVQVECLKKLVKTSNCTQNAVISSRDKWINKPEWSCIL